MIAILALALCRLLKKAGPQAQHILWVVSLGLAIVIPALPMLRTRLSGIPASATSAEHLSVIAGTSQSISARHGVIALAPSIIVVLLCLYLCATLYFVVRFAISLRWTSVLLKQAALPSLDPATSQLWDRCHQTLDINGATIRTSPRVSGPVVLGLAKPILLVPVSFLEECSSDDLLTAFAHECAHIQRHDFLKNLFYEAVSTIVAFHPVTWMLKSQIAQTREMICDELAVTRLVDSRSFTQSLLRLAARIAVNPLVSSSPAVGIFDANILEKRIMYIGSAKPSINRVVKYCFVTVSAAMLFSMGAAGTAAAIGVEEDTRPSAQPSVDQTKPQNVIYRIGGDVLPPKVISFIDPVFPESARKSKARFSGVCVVKLVVDSAGIPSDIEVTHSLAPDFDRNAVQAVKQYRFSPATHFGKPVAVTVNIEVNFQKY